MKGKEVDGDISYLPQEIIINILKRLPIKTLIRFQSVCKEWRNLSKTQSFIADHLNHSNHQNPCLLVQHYDYKRYPWNLCCIDSEMQFSEFQNPPPPPLLDFFLHDGKMIGSVNGLLCVHCIKQFNPSCHSLLVCNPSIREIRLVPEIEFHEDYDDCFIEFGFSSIINDYKIVIVCVFERYAKICEARVYSLISGSWKKVKFRPNDTARVTSESVTVNGVMYWLGSKQIGSDEGDVIVSFDLANEVFTLIPMPEPHPLDLTVYEEKLAIVYIIINSEDSTKNLCVMEEGVGASGERWGWTKRCISLPSRLYHLTIWRNEIVCLILGKGEHDTIVLFNPTTKTIKKLAVDKYNCSDLFLNYVESIVPVGRMKSFTNSQ